MISAVALIAACGGALAAAGLWCLHLFNRHISAIRADAEEHRRIVALGLCSACGACASHGACADEDNPLGPDDCPDCEACCDCIAECQAQRGLRSDADAYH